VLGPVHKLSLLYSATRDGWSSDEFDRRCKGERLLVVLQGRVNGYGAGTAAFCDVPWTGAGSGGKETNVSGGAGVVFGVVLNNASAPQVLPTATPQATRIRAHNTHRYASTCAFSSPGAIPHFGFALENKIARVVVSKEYHFNLDQVEAYAPRHQCIVTAARSELEWRNARLAPAPQPELQGAACLGDLPALSMHVASAMQQESAALALAQAKLQTEEKAFEQCEAVVEFLSRGATSEIVRLEAGGIIYMRREVLTTCGKMQSQLARQFSIGAQWRSGETVWIEDDSASFRKLLSYLRIRGMPAELCCGLYPLTLAARVVNELSDDDRVLFRQMVDCFFPGKAADFVFGGEKVHVSSADDK